MKRWLLPSAALAVLIIGAVLTLAGNYGRQLVHDQLAPQKITFAPYDESGQNGDNYEAYPELRDRAGTTVTDGLADALGRLLIVCMFGDIAGRLARPAHR